MARSAQRPGLGTCLIPIATPTGDSMELTQVKTVLREYMLETLMRNPGYPLQDDEPLITGGLFDSFALAELAVFIEGAFNVYIPDIDLTVANMDTLNQVASWVMRDCA
jgi:acyl carrier protein